MGCNCNGKKSGVRYEVAFSDGSRQKYDTLSEAQAAGQATHAPYTFKAVPA